MFLEESNRKSNQIEKKKCSAISFQKLLIFHKSGCSENAQSFPRAFI